MRRSVAPVSGIHSFHLNRGLGANNRRERPEGPVAALSKRHIWQIRCGRPAFGYVWRIPCGPDNPQPHFECAVGARIPFRYNALSMIASIQLCLPAGVNVCALPVFSYDAVGFCILLRARTA